MAISITATSPQPASLMQRLLGTEPATVVTTQSTTTLTSVAGSNFDVMAALRGGGIGTAVAGVLGGVSLLGKVALPVIGAVTTAAGLGRLALTGGAVGVAAASLPFVADVASRRPGVRAVLIGAGVGAAAGAVLPFISARTGAVLGAGVGVLLHERAQRLSTLPHYPGYVAMPGWHPYGMQPGVSVPDGMVPVTPSFGAYPAMNGGMLQPGAPAGSALLPAQAQPMPLAAPIAPMASAPAAQPAARQVTKPAAPRFRNARTFTDGAGNLRLVGSGKILKAAARPAAAPAVQQPVVGNTLGQVTNPAAYLPGMGGMLPFPGGSPFSAGPNMAMLAAMMPQLMAGAAAAPAAGAVPTLTAAQPDTIPALPSN